MTQRLDRTAVMRDAHKRFRDGRRLGLGWTFSRCLRTAWAAARIRRDMEQRAPAPAIETRRVSSLARTTPAIVEQAKGAPSRARRRNHIPACLPHMDGPIPAA